MLEIFEKNIAWWNEIAAGAGLILGYIFFCLYWLSTPESSVQVDTQKTVLIKTTIGQIPKFPDDPTAFPTQKEIAKFPLQDVDYLAPKLGESGSPIIETTNITFSGRGSPKVLVNQVEVLMPVLADPSYYISKSKEGSTFNPVIIMKGTNFYITEKTVEFEGALSADILAVRVAAFFSGLALLLFLLKLRRALYGQLKEAHFPKDIEIDD